MKKASEIYEKAEYGFSILDREKAKDPNYCRYTPMLHEFGEILMRVEDSDDVGDTFILYKRKKDGALGYLAFGWTSTAADDAYECCETIEEMQELMDDLYNSIIWFKNHNEAFAWFNAEEREKWEGYYYSNSVYLGFLENVRHYLDVMCDIEQLAKRLLKAVNIISGV